MNIWGNGLECTSSFGNFRINLYQNQLNFVTRFFDVSDQRRLWMNLKRMSVTVFTSLWKKRVIVCIDENWCRILCRVLSKFVIKFCRHLQTCGLVWILLQKPIWNCASTNSVYWISFIALGRRYICRDRLLSTQHLIHRLSSTWQAQGTHQPHLHTIYYSISSGHSAIIHHWC
jgi:hypothetical protein